MTGSVRDIPSKMRSKSIMSSSTLFAFLLLASLSSFCQSGNSDYPLNWLFSSRNSRNEASKSNIERETQQDIQINQEPVNFAIFQTGQVIHKNSMQDMEDRFQCVDPTRPLFDQFVSQFNRSFDSNSDKLERLNLFYNTIKRIILFNRIVQNDVLNHSSYDLRPKIKNSYYIIPINGDYLNTWFPDITDCELGVIKNVMFKIFYSLDDQNPSEAYKIALDNSAQLPLLSLKGFQQLSEILLVRLYDRFRGDDKFDRLFQWPNYIKRLSAYAYNRIQANSANFKAKLGLISFAYPFYFKDLKYNEGAINRTNDNIEMHEEHEKFINVMKRKIATDRERNRRFVIYRERATMMRILDEAPNSWLNFSQQPEWQRLRMLNDLRSHQSPVSSNTRVFSPNEPYSDRLRMLPLTSSSLNANEVRTSTGLAPLKSPFSDLTDAEFVAYLTNDFSIIDNNKESVNYIEQNFPIRPLDEALRDAIASEILTRRTIQEHLGAQSDRLTSIDDQPDNQRGTVDQQGVPMKLARQVVDELISDVGLPIGPIAVSGISEADYRNTFMHLSNLFGKIYGLGSNLNQPSFLPMPDSTLMSDERLRRFDEFKKNLGRFRAWMIKEQWNLDGDDQKLVMLRLADMSWLEIKLSLFKLCCLSSEQLAVLAAENVTLHYLASNSYLCNSVNQLEDDSLWSRQSSNQRQRNPFSERLQQAPSQADEMLALELYYYYSVHFNKHHNDMRAFNSSFSIFKSNIEQIKRLSCARSLTTYRSLKLKRLDTLNTVDELDPRRSYTDDMNLDRFRYFTVPRLDSSVSDQARNESNESAAFDRLRTIDQSRAGISYMKSPFSGLINDQARLMETQRGVSMNPANLDWQTQSSLPTSYRENSAYRVYDLIRQRYRLCMKILNGVEPDEVETRRLQCQASGRFADQAVAPSWSQDESQSSPSARLQLQRKDTCSFYWTGLEPWSEGLLSQDKLSPILIQQAKC